MSPQRCLPGFDIHRFRTSERLTIAEIQTAVADFYHLPVSEMTSARRNREIAGPRQVAMFLARELTPKSFPDIGRRFGDRDHTTVLHAVRQVKKRCDANLDYRHDVESLRSLLS